MPVRDVKCMRKIINKPENFVDEMVGKLIFQGLEEWAAGKNTGRTETS
jgi:hypothetical protein